MLGFGAIGTIAVATGPNNPAVAPTFNPQPFSNWSAPRKAGLAVAVIASGVAGFVAPAAPVHAGPFTQFSQPIAPRVVLPDEQPSALFEIEPPTSPPFTGFARFDLPIRAKYNVALFTNFTIVPFTPVVDTHDGVWVKRKKKRSGPDPLDLELEERAKRRAAIELAIYGPEVTYEPPPSPIAEPSKPPPNTEELTRIIMQMKAAEFEAKRRADEQDDEDVLEMILKDL